jgi:DNA polymerase-3 subunit epsilon
MSQSHDFEAMAQMLDAQGGFRVLRRMATPACYAPLGEVDQSKLRVMAILDTETTGLEAWKDKLIELGYVKVRFNPATGLIHDVLATYSGLQDPGIPIPPHITKITGITDEDVAGKSIDREKVLADLADVDVFMAHNASHDRLFFEAVFPEFKDHWWVCSNAEGPWEAMHLGTTKLEFIAFKVANVFYEAHRSEIDCRAVASFLNEPSGNGDTILGVMLSKSRMPSYRVWAVDAPYDKKDHLKLSKDYRWSDGTNPASPIKAWFKDVYGQAALADELVMLGNEIYPKRAMVTVDSITGRERFSGRYVSRDKHPVEKVAPVPKGATLGLGL